MLGRLLRLLVGLAVLAGAVDIWQPSLIPHAIPINFGAFEDTRTIAAALLGVIGFSFVFAAVWPPARKPAEARPALNMSAFSTPWPHRSPLVAPVSPPALAAPEPALEASAYPGDGTGL